MPTFEAITREKSNVLIGAKRTDSIWTDFEKNWTTDALDALNTLEDVHLFQ